MSGGRKHVLSIAGFDPSSGAGVTSDCKTFEAHGLYGLGVCTAQTVQNDAHFKSVNWLDFDFIQEQCAVLFEQYEIDFVKIGLIENLEVLDKVINALNQFKPDIKIIWDPILSASAGFVFHQDLQDELLHKVLSKLFLITPNKEEVLKITRQTKVPPAAEALKQYCNVYVSSAFNLHKRIADTLYFRGSDRQSDFFSVRLKDFSKHGSGCVLSASITANLARGVELEQACVYAKDYALDFLQSNDGSLGYHRNFRV